MNYKKLILIGMLWGLLSFVYGYSDMGGYFRLPLDVSLMLGRTVFLPAILGLILSFFITGIEPENPSFAIFPIVWPIMCMLVAIAIVLTISGIWQFFERIRR